MLKYVLPGVELMPDKLSLRMLRIFTKSIPDFHKMDYHAEVRLSTSVPEVTAGTNKGRFEYFCGGANPCAR